jgi:hypothetical protein
MIEEVLLIGTSLKFRGCSSLHITGDDVSRVTKGISDGFRGLSVILVHLFFHLSIIIAVMV